MKAYASNESLSYSGYTIRLSQESRQLFPNIETTAERRELVVKVFTITPEIAEALLEETNAVNRSEKPAAIEKYTRDLQEGKWFATHQGLAFGIVENDDGELVWVLFDGQNRLRAVVKSGVSQEFLVFFGFREGFRIMNAIDSGKNRSHSDALTVLKKAGKVQFRNPAQASKILNAAWRGDEPGEGRLDKLDLQGLAMASSKAILFFEDTLYKGISPLPKASVSGALFRAFYSYPEYLDRYTEAAFMKRLREFVEIITGNEVTHPVSGIATKDSYAFAFRKWMEQCFEAHKSADNALSKIRASMGGGVTSILYSVAASAIRGFLDKKPFRGFSKFKKDGRGSKLWHELEGSQDGFGFPVGVAKNAKRYSTELVEEKGYELA